MTAEARGPHPPRPSDAELLALLAASGSPVAIRDRRPCAYSTSFALEELDVLWADGRRRRLVFKDLGPNALLAEARDHRPAFLYDPRREVTVYRHVLEGRGLGTAELFGSALDPAGGRYWLALEHVAGGQLRHTDDPALWDAAARCLARLHSIPVPTQGDASAALARYDAAYFGRWLDRAIARARSGSADDTVLSSADTLRRAVAGAAAVLAADRPVVVHGDFYPANVLVRSGAAAAVCPIDWELAGVGPGAVDLAALVAGEWADADRDRMLSAYADEAARLGRPPADPRALRRSVAAARVVAAVQWLGWAHGWSAPPDQSRDWLRDALSAAAVLDAEGGAAGGPGGWT